MHYEVPLTAEELIVPSLGECQYRTPLNFISSSTGHGAAFVSESRRVRADILTDAPASDVSFELAGPRENLFFDPKHVTAAIVTCGGLSPGLNNVIWSLFHELRSNYQAKHVLGIRNGYLGLTPDPAGDREPVTLTFEQLSDVHKLGGTILGTSRGAQDPEAMVDFLVERGINMLFCLGGDGTQRGAHAIHQEVQRRGLKIAVVGVPKTIDNDIPFVNVSFGFPTAIEKASAVVRGAHVEARAAINGIGLVKLMGRHAGFIAAGATVVSQEVNFLLIPEVAFPLEGSGGFLDALERRMRNRGHAVVVVAEGAGQHLFDQRDQRRDASGNLLNEDIGTFLKQRIKDHFQQRGLPISLKYLDPSYYLRSVPANAYDRLLCDHMARNAVHAAMAGKTGMIVGVEHNRYIHVPIPAVVNRKRRVDLEGDLYRACLQITQQPRW